MMIIPRNWGGSIFICFQTTVSMLMWPSKEGVSTEAVVPLGGCTVLVISAKGAHQQNLVQLGANEVGVATHGTGAL